MKRRDLERHLSAHGAHELREGSRHSWWGFDAALHRGSPPPRDRLASRPGDLQATRHPAADRIALNPRRRRPQVGDSKPMPAVRARRLILLLAALTALVAAGASVALAPRGARIERSEPRPGLHRSRPDPHRAGDIAIVLLTPGFRGLKRRIRVGVLCCRRRRGPAHRSSLHHPRGGGQDRSVRGNQGVPDIKQGVLHPRHVCERGLRRAAPCAPRHAGRLLRVSFLAPRRPEPV